MIILIGAIATALTWAMFSTRQSMLGFPAAIFWAVFGGDCYIHSTATWDIYFLLAFASLLGMTFFSIYAAFGLREKKDTGTDEDEFIDEKGGGKEQYYGETKAQASKANAGEHDLPSDTDMDSPTKPSWRTRQLHKRADERKTGSPKKRWGGF